MKLDVNKTNRYLAKSVGVEIESDNDMMRTLSSGIKSVFMGGNSESGRIYECQTVPMDLDDVVNVTLLGEVVRRCIPNYVVGIRDKASASAHCHVVGFNTDLEESHIEALMVGLMPFLSLGWMRPQFEEYSFRASVTGSGDCSSYARFVDKRIDVDTSRYGGRYTWLRDQTHRHGSPSGEIRSNENTPLWAYFINPILTNEDLVEKLRAMSITDNYKKNAEKIRTRKGNLFILHDFIEEVKQLIIPFLMDSLDTIVENIKEDQRDFGTAILTAYLEENMKEYDKLVSGIILGDKEVVQTFKLIDKAYETNKENFCVIKEIK